MRKKWKHYIDRMLTFALIGILLPLFITIICQRMRLEEVIYGTYDAITEAAEREGGEELEEQLPFILAKEIRADAEDAALMAQCVIARTTLYDAAARGEEQPAAFSEEELRQVLGETYEKAMERLETCVEETSGQVLSWNGGYAYAAYHAISAGSTRDMSRSAEAAVPYLPAVECPADLTAEGTLSVIYCEETDILKRCGEHFAETCLRCLRSRLQSGMRRVMYSRSCWGSMPAPGKRSVRRWAGIPRVLRSRRWGKMCGS